jgi:hypothetical protein
MANPTTNFGWVMPTSASLVTNLPADFNTFGQAVDTSMAQLKGGSTGQVLSKTSATDMAFTWVTPTDQTPLTTKGDLFTFTTVDARLGVGANGYILSANSATATGLEWIAANPGDITGVTAGTGISGGGTSGDVTVTNSMATAMTTKGDLVPATGSGAFARLGVGANDTVLTADSTAATGMKWATVAASGGMTLLSTTTLSGASTTISSISGSYKQLVAYIYGVNGTSTGYEMIIEPNGTSSICTGVFMQNQNSVAAVSYRTASSISISALSKNTTNNATTLVIDNYASSTNYKPFQYYGFVENSGGAGVQACELAGAIISNTAVSSLKFSCLVTGTFNAGTVLLYGVN